MKASRKAITVALLSIVGLVAVALVVLGWLAGVRRHRASTYGISDPGRAALRIENKTSDFAISRISIGNAETNVFDRDVDQEIGMGTGIVLDLEPGEYIIQVYWVESGQVEAYVQKGESLASFSVSPGEAALLRLESGRAPHGGMMWIPPELVLK
jgi:hypothetical protein